MVLPDDEVMLLDFGIAKALSDDSADRGSHPTDADPLTMEGAIIGTPEYVSPEQARGEAVGVESDVFSFGTLLVEMLTGRSPFRRNSAVETLTAVIFETAPTVGPHELDAIAARCLAKDPRDRFRDASELLAALGALKEGATPRGPTAIAPTMAGETLGDTGSPARSPANPSRRLRLLHRRSRARLSPLLRRRLLRTPCPPRRLR
jgi:eukaryotic-like serine/threonine-protein kinase